MLEPLLPIKLSKDNPSYKAVTELSEVLEKSFKDKKLKNIALTGPFGSGKSSILQTLQKDISDYEYLPISLATLQADENPSVESSTEKTNSDPTEALNRKIEYSILQQLIYREKAETVPNSRFRRIVHLTDKQLRDYSISTILCIISLLIVFEPKIFKVDTIYSLLDFGEWNIVFDLICSGYLIWILYIIFEYVIKSYCNSKLNKLNLKDGEIEVIENNSIFNKHLDEILYFFQTTDYNVVIIEDLDRFGTPNIFLKLRELNFLINESKIVGRHIVFIYAVKDDIFINEERTKFFDYIATVIPVINPSNSKDKLKEALISRGCKDGEIPDDDLSEMAFFIQDMRILTNIANEYWQYREKLCSKDKQQLNHTKLLAMIVYKNYHPKDFAQLHKREGKVYKCIRSKGEFINLALKSLEVEKKQLVQKKAVLESSHHLKLKELKMLFLNEMSRNLGLNIFSIHIDGDYRTFNEIVDNDSLFEQLKKLTRIKGFYNYCPSGSSNYNTEFSFKTINESVNFSNRLDSLKEHSYSTLNKESLQIHIKELSVKSLKLHAIISKYHIGKDDCYKTIELSPLMDVFIRRGYLDEDYYDYISYFYPGMISPSDRELLLSIKIQKKESYDYHINKIQNFIKELQPYMFEDDAILNNELLDFLASKKSRYSDFFTLIMNRLEGEIIPLDFISQYFTFGKQQSTVFSHYINRNKVSAWSMIDDASNENQKNTLRIVWFKYSDEITDKQTDWLSNNYSFLTTNAESLTHPVCLKLIDKCIFIELNNENSELLDYIIKNDRYIIVTENLCLVANFLLDSNLLTNSNLNLTLIEETNNEYLIEYVRSNINESIKCFSKTTNDESPESIIYILNSEIEESLKVNYLKSQMSRIDKLDSITDTNNKIIAIKLNLIKPTWEAIDSFYNVVGTISSELILYIEHYSKELGDITISEALTNRIVLFEKLIGSNLLDLNTFKLLINSFNLQFANFEPLAAIDSNRLQILIKNRMIAFGEDVVSIMSRTSAYSDYLIHYAEVFCSNLGFTYNINASTAIAILNSDSFSASDKRDIVDIVPNREILSSQELVNIIIDILLKTNIEKLDEELLIELIRISNTTENRVKLASRIITHYQYGIDLIANVLNQLKGVYEEIAGRAKEPTIEKSESNLILVRTLKQTGFISSYQEKDKGIKIRQKRFK